MKQQRLSLSLPFLVSFCALAFQFPFDVLRAEETPIPSATPAATAALLTSTPPPVSSATPAPKGAVGISPTPEPPSVRWVGVHKWGEEQRGINDIYAQRGDDIWVDVINFKDWVKSLEEEKKKPENSDVRDLILYLDHIPLKGVSPIYWHENTWSIGGVPPVETTDTTIGFSLVRNEDSKLGWSHVLNQPVFTRKAIVSVGFVNGEEMNSELTPDKNTGKKDQQFYLTVIPKFRTAFGLIVILGALLAFLGLARHTHIIRDAAAPRRPDGQRPYSLARGQMAFWFFSRHRLLFLPLDCNGRNGYA